MKRTIPERIKASIFRGDDLNGFMQSFWDEEIKPLIGDTLEEIASRVIRSIFDDDDDDDVVYISSKRSKTSRKRDRDYDLVSKKKKSKSSRMRDRDDDDDDGYPNDLGPDETYMIRFKSANAANEMVDRMVRICKADGEMTAADFYSECDVSSINFRIQDFGLDDVSDIRRAKVKRGRDGQWHIYFPKFVKLGE